MEQVFMSAFLMVISATPLLLRTKHVGVPSNPGLSFHEAATVIATLAFMIKERTSLACVVTLFPNLT